MMDFNDIQTQFLQCCFRSVNDFKSLANEIASLAGGEFAWQDFVSKNELTYPLRSGRFPEGDSFGEKKLGIFFDIFSMASSNLMANGQNRASPVACYVHATTAYGLCRYQLPESTQFGFASIGESLQLQLAEFDLSSDLGSAFGASLFQIATDQVENFFEPELIQLVCACLAINRPIVGQDRTSIVEFIVERIGPSKVEELSRRYDIRESELDSLERLLERTAKYLGD